MRVVFIRKERLLCFRLFLYIIHRCCGGFIIYGFHTLCGKCSRILNLTVSRSFENATWRVAFQKFWIIFLANKDVLVLLQR